MTKYCQEVEQEDGWSQEIAPNMNLYKMGCCDCGLVHDITYWVVKVSKVNDNGTWECEDADESYRVIFRARRNNRSTGQVRRHKKEIYSAPEQSKSVKQWQGLSNNKITSLFAFYGADTEEAMIDFARAIEQELKHKNGF